MKTTKGSIHAQSPISEDDVQLREHLTDSPFGKGIDELQAMAVKLERDIGAAVQKLPPTLMKQWRALHGGEGEKIGWKDRTPWPSPSDSDQDQVRPPYTDSDLKPFLEALSEGPFLDIYDRIVALHFKLVELNRWLSPNWLDALLESSECRLCRWLRQQGKHAAKEWP